MIRALPNHGKPWEILAEEMRLAGAHDVKWRDGKAAVYVFNAGPEVERIQKAAYVLYMSENGLGPAAFPSLRDMEACVVGWGLSLLHAPAEAVGHMTTGGTDSITMAFKAARDLARDQGRTGPLNIVLPRSAHPAFDKAAALMEVVVRRTPLKALAADPEAMAAAVDASTVMMVGSAPCFPYGLIDPIGELAAVAAEKQVWLHVDACVGGYIAPFVRMNGADLPAFDFSIPQVRSISADLHKYGYCAKGASTVFFRTDADRRYMPFTVSDWPGGPMTTPTLAGTRPGGAIAAAYAVMSSLGVDGYRALQAQVTAAREAVETGVRSRGFEVIGRPQLGIVAYTHPQYDCRRLWGLLRQRGWFTSMTRQPQGLHLMLSPVHQSVTDLYLEDLDWAVESLGGTNDQTAAAVGYGA